MWSKLWERVFEMVISRMKKKRGWIDKRGILDMVEFEWESMRKNVED